MKTILSSLLFFALSFTANAGTSLQYQMPEGFTASSNWKSDFHKVFGAQTASAWMAGQIANGAELLVNSTGDQLILIFQEDFSDRSEMETRMESDLQEGNGCNLNLSSTLASFGKNGMAANYTGTISGTKTLANMICLAPSNGTQCIMILTLSRAMFNAPNLVEQTGSRMANGFTFNNTINLTAK